MYRYLRRNSDYKHTFRRSGSKEANRNFTAIKGSLEAERILEKAILDGTWLDCFAIDDELMIPVGRPYLMMIVDVCSRYPLAYVLSFVPESLETAMACLRQAVRPKHHIHQSYPDINRRWIAYGVPRTLLVDNGWQYTGGAFSEACADGGISVEWAPVRTPEYKGIVERLFGTLNTQLIHKLPGGIPLKPHQMKALGIKADGLPILTLSQINELITQYIVDNYGAQFHRTLKMSPEAMWRQREPIDYVPYAKDLRTLDRALGRVKHNARISHKGVEFLGLTYLSPDVSSLLNDLLPRASARNARRGVATVKIKYHPEDLSEIFVWNPVRRDYVPLPCTQRRYSEHLSEYRHKAVQDFAEAQQDKYFSEDEWCDAYVRLREKMLSFMPATGLRDRRRAQRFLAPYGDERQHGQSDVPSTGDAPLEYPFGLPISTVKSRHDCEPPPRWPSGADCLGNGDQQMAHPSNRSRQRSPVRTLLMRSTLTS